MSNNRLNSAWMAGIAASLRIFFWLAGTAAYAAAKPDTNATAAFEKLKSLAGTWEAANQRGKITSSYEVISNGTAVAEHIHVPGESEMLTVYHLDGDHLVLTHYCTAGNQPRMQAETYDPASNQLVFRFAGGDNLSNPNTGHMHNVTFKFAGNDEFSADWGFQENGKAKFVENIEYHRVK